MDGTDHLETPLVRLHAGADGDAVDISMHRERRTKRGEIAVPKAAGLQPQTCRLQTLVNKCGMRKRKRIKIVLSPEARISRKGRGSIGLFSVRFDRV